MGLLGATIMKIDKTRLKEEQELIRQLSNGIDPTTGLQFSDDTILNNRDLRSSFVAITKTYDEFIRFQNNESQRGNKRNSKTPFSLTIDEYEKLTPVEQELTVSNIAYTINKAAKRKGMRQFRAVQITHWLETNGYLLSIIDEENGAYRKTPTAQGEKIGIIPREKVNSIGKTYSTNLYTSDAQAFIYEHLFEMIE